MRLRNEQALRGSGVRMRSASLVRYYSGLQISVQSDFPLMQALLFNGSDSLSTN
jgi:hypothetical protein